MTKSSITSSWVSTAWGMTTTCAPIVTSAVATTPASTINPAPTDGRVRQRRRRVHEGGRAARGEAERARAGPGEQPDAPAWPVQIAHRRIRSGRDQLDRARAPAARPTDVPCRAGSSSKKPDESQRGHGRVDGTDQLGRLAAEAAGADE